MKTRYIKITFITLMITACISPLILSEDTTAYNPDSPEAPTTDSSLFMPVVVKSIVSSPTPFVTPTPTLRPTPVVSPTPPPSGSIIADHTALSTFANIPGLYLNEASVIDTLFMHQSTGNNIKTMGLGCLAGLLDPNYGYPEECHLDIPYVPYDHRNWDWPEWPTPMSDAIAKTDQWVSIANAQQQNYQLLGMKFCYVDGYNQNFDYYKQAMEQLEQSYPTKAFVWATSALWDEDSAGGINYPSCLAIQDFNQQLRTYAQANNIILYDIADIESHDPDGNYCQLDGCEAMCLTYSDGIGGGGGGHPDIDGSIRLAQGFWWMMARVAGWDGTTTK